ncbi:MAG: TRAP transporter large permease subunit [Rhodocyclaceae bacterium]|nr:TRAP transporter large permease subunit [Rhodocyclaceae bacterium]
MAAAGLWMLGAVAVLMIATGLPSWLALIGVAVAFGAFGIVSGECPLSFLAALPARLLGLFDNDLLQALPLYVFMGALLYRLPLADILFRSGQAVLARTGAGASLAGLGLGMLLAPMNGSVGASVATLSRAMLPRLDAARVPPPQAAALVCVASTLGVVVPPSLVLILLGDAMLRAHTEAVNVTREAVRIVNTQDIFRGALVPALLLLALCLALAWWSGRERTAAPATPLLVRERLTAILAAGIILGLLGSVTLGYLYAVEASATGGVLLFLYGLASRRLDRETLGAALRDTLAISGALFALLVAATTFTFILRAFGTDRWIASALASLSGPERLVVVMAILLACAFVLDAFEMIFVVIPVVMPPLLMAFPDAPRAAVLTLLILQTSFLLPPLGYAVLLVRQQHARPLPQRHLAVALLPYLAAQLGVLALVAACPDLLWRSA